jgi:hypothetical protein
VKGNANLNRVDIATGRVDPGTRGNREFESYSRAGCKTVALVSILSTGRRNAIVFPSGDQRGE